MSTEGETLQVSVHLTGARYVLSAVSVLVVVQPISEVPEVFMNYPVLLEVYGANNRGTRRRMCLIISV